MKLNNEIIVLDLEATSNQETEGERPAEQTNNFIIEIGAVLISRDLEIVSQFQSLVQPEERVTPFITNITHITQEMVDAAPKWDVVASQFEDWVKTHCKNIKNVRLGAWGNYFDMPLLRKGYRFYNRPFPFSGTMLDIKTSAFDWAALSGNRTDKLSVEHVAHLMEIVPDGQYHRALVDAVTEAKIYIESKKKLSQGFYLPNKDGKPYQYIKVSL